MKNKTKFLLALSLIAMLTVLFAISVSAAEPVETWDISATENDNVTAYLYEDTENAGHYTLIIDGTGKMKSWDPLYYGYDDIAPWCGTYETKITSVNIEEGVTNIGSYAFQQFSRLTDIIVPDSVTEIGSGAFECSNLSRIVIPESVNYIGFESFKDCYGLTVYCETLQESKYWGSEWNMIFFDYYVDYETGNCIDTSIYAHVVWDYKNTIQSEIFTFKGYSFDWTGSMAVGFDIDYEAIRLYEELTGEMLDFGVVFAGFDALGGNMPLDANGNAHADVVKFSTKGYDYIQYDFVITDMTEEYFDISFVISAYICNGAMTKFVQANGLSDTVTGITYNEAKGA